MSLDNPTYWRRKLSAYLHDSPDKVISIVDHEDRARSLAQAEGFHPEETTRKSADIAASAADRLPWPKTKLGDTVLCRSEFDATDNALRHPLGMTSIHFLQPFASPTAALEISQKSRPLITDDDPRAAFICAWRFWQNWASAADERFSCLPAETRLPDHTIWNHLAVTSAFQGCLGGSLKDWLDARSKGQRPQPPPDRPAFLLFTIGPVQELIAAARSTRDLWSGSYLLSYLIGTALARIALDFGPDHVLFPNLANQPILDLLLRRELWDHHKAADGTELWRAFGYYDQRERERLLTPSLPNRVLALLPATMAEHPQWQTPDSVGRTGAARYAAHLESEVRAQLRRIGDSVAEHCADKVPGSVDIARFRAQLEKLLEVHWQVLPWPESIKSAIESTARLPGEEREHPLDPLRGVLAMLDRMRPEHRDPWCFRDQQLGSPDKAGPLSQVSNAWSALFALVSWQLDAAKTTRSFLAWSDGGWRVDRWQNKDSLNGKEEACLEVPTDQNEAKNISRRLADGNENAFKPRDLLGASTLLKRLWHLTWLSKEHAFFPNEGDFAMPNTRSIAAHQPFALSADDESGSEDEGKYFAVLALDGDEVGKWISGAKCPEVAGQLSREAHAYFTRHGNAEFLKGRRPLSPSFHLQFSELLANFGLHCARPIVEAHDGCLIYSGGDDVLAMLPADTALACARALRAAFKGEPRLSELAKGIVNRGPRNREEWKSDGKTPLFAVEHPGFIKLTEQAAPKGSGAEAGLLDEPVRFPFLVPGSAADCSVGIAIAHFKSPLQDVVREAQRAEKRAKNELGRSAVAVTLMKRSGETIEWGCQWDSGGLEIHGAILEAIGAGAVSNKFPHRVVELLGAYLTETSPLAAKSLEPVKDFPVVDIVRREFRHAVERQKQKDMKDEHAKLKELAEPRNGSSNQVSIDRYLNHVIQRAAVALAANLCERLEVRLAKLAVTAQMTKKLKELGEAKVVSEQDREGELRDLLDEAESLQGLPDADAKWLKSQVESTRRQLDRQRTEDPIQALIGLCQTAAFIARNLSEEKPETPNETFETQPAAERQLATP
ncbi:MAG: type III-B CRISPR-associated protein Cas10/Cmr2 [Verrucomicrobia bacterium]|nr:type III-B CRISPR-associated protein Cas10/Cmr2 [Verrucomicrobiota bacterium]